MVSVLDSGAAGLGLKWQPRGCQITVLGKTVHTHCASVHRAAKLVAALLRVAGVTGVTAGLREVMAAYRRVYDSGHLQAEPDCQEPGSAPGPYAR